MPTGKPSGCCLGWIPPQAPIGPASAAAIARPLSPTTALPLTRKLTRKSRQTGYTYLLLLFAVAGLGIISAGVAENWSTLAQRERERELLFVGNQYREALRRYAEASPAASSPYPATLAELLHDPRFPDTRRHLRQLYPDPLTGRHDWVLMRQEGRITGLYSPVERTPLKQDGFATRDREFAGAKSYRDWKFYVAGSGAMPLPAQPAGRVGELAGGLATESATEWANQPANAQATPRASNPADDANVNSPNEAVQAQPVFAAP
ncbi:type II secretion system protein [Rhodocyclus gracilis]|uniref:type II secretion system protein n=1 Tax=Rhodocyclus gracilis TaxID=2929842 RepID=UPI0018900CC1|nr:type II secretion system protein [Rhodocyclus gracilis]